MERRFRGFAGHAYLLFCAALLLEAEARPQQAVSGPMYLREESHAVSRPLRQMRTHAAETPGSTSDLAALVEADEEEARPASISGGQPKAVFPSSPDPALQQSAGPLVATTPGLDFEGIAAGSGNTWRAPDPNGAAGATQYVQWVNARFAVYRKSDGHLLYGPVPAKTLWASLGGPCATVNLADGIVEYDKAAQRFIITHHSASSSTGPYYQCVAVSQTSDATGLWYLYSFLLTNYLPDYPKMSVWPDAYYLSNNLQDQSNGFKPVGSLLCAFDRNAMLTGATARNAVCFTIQIGTTDASLLPSDLDGTTPPPTGSPNYFMNLGTNALNLYQFHVDFTTPGNSTFTGPTMIPVAPFTPACPGRRGVCIPQQGTTQVLDSVSDRLMYRLAYRNFGNYEALVATHSVNPQTQAYAGIRWYEIHNPGGTPIVYQQGTYSPDGTSRWMGSIAMDKQGNIAVGYSVSSSARFPGIKYTGRLASDPLGNVETENGIKAGLGSQQPNDNRWGDYTAMSVDPGDDCTFWYTNEYLPANGIANWHTRIASFKFKACN